MDVRTLCLGILSLGDATGYEIKKMVAEGSFSFFSEASYGSIYPALTKLTKEGLVTCEAKIQDGRPDKKVYSLTNNGEADLTNSLKRDPGPDKNRSEFLAAILFAEAVSPERVNDLVDERVRQHKQKINSLTALLDEDMTVGSRFVVEYGIAMQQAALTFLRENRHVLDDNP
jgi:DNA-binding PadR family transcriptional regulator